MHVQCQCDQNKLSTELTFQLSKRSKQSRRSKRRQDDQSNCSLRSKQRHRYKKRGRIWISKQRVSKQAIDQYKGESQNTSKEIKTKAGDQNKEKEIKTKEHSLPTWPVRLEGDRDPKLDQTFEQQHYTSSLGL